MRCVPLWGSENVNESHEWLPLQVQHQMTLVRCGEQTFGVGSSTASNGTGLEAHVAPVGLHVARCLLGPPTPSGCRVGGCIQTYNADACSTSLLTFCPSLLLRGPAPLPFVMLRRGALVCGLLFWGSSTAAPPSASSAAGTSRGSGGIDDSSRFAPGRRLTGKFLHITGKSVGIRCGVSFLTEPCPDFHPDPFYKTYSSTAEEAACHRHRGPAGIYGAETSGCDSPYALVNQTFQWINDNLKHDIDFVIWTGDSARHDNDELLPRSAKQVVQQNEYMVAKFAEVFGKEDKHGRMDEWAIPVVPTFGNNDIMPHNIFLEGPNRWTKKYLDVWRSFIPEAQRHQFQQGGWFSVEVIPGKLAVISLNTMYASPPFRLYPQQLLIHAIDISSPPIPPPTAAQRNTSPVTNTWNGCASNSRFYATVA
jgi:hypothetical protein